MDSLAIVEGIACVGDLLDPVGKAAKKLPIIVGEAGREVERAVRADGADRAGGDAKLAFEAGVVVDRMIAVLNRTKLTNFGWIRLR